MAKHRSPPWLVVISAGVCERVSWGRRMGILPWPPSCPVLLVLEWLFVDYSDIFWTEAGPLFQREGSWKLIY